MTTELYWLGFVGLNKERSVQRFPSQEAAMAHREKVKNHWSIPAHITNAFPAASKEEALQIMDRY